MKFLLIASVMAYGAFFSEIAMAQDAGYVPPPMFEEQAPLPPPSQQPARQAPVVKRDSGALIAPRISPRVDYKDSAGQAAPATGTVEKMKPILERRSSPQVKRESKPVPVPPKKPSAPEAVKVEAKAAKPEAKNATTQPVATPDTAVAKKPAPAKISVMAAPVPPKAASVVTHDGYVKGPKTMPAIPTQTVDAVEVFEPDDAQGLTILERHQRQTKAKKDAAEKELIEKKEAERLAKEAVEAAPEGYEKTAQDVLKKILPYPAGQLALTEADMAAVAEGVKSELAKRAAWRVQIRAYASNGGAGPGGDKRIALGRAMALRKTLMDQGIKPEKIDIRAEGASTEDGQLSDRVDLYLFGPARAPEKG